MGASIYWDGCHPHNLPFWVFPLAGKDLWTYVASLVAEHKPEMVVVCQDFPYSHTFYHNLHIDFSKTKFVIITPIDGTPVFPPWAELVDMADGTLVISKFGVEALRQLGKRADLLQPGINPKEFFPLPNVEKLKLREKVGIPGNAFVLGSMGMNQGRKNFPIMIEAFLDFSLDKKNTYYIIDADKAGYGGWDLPQLIGCIIRDRGWNPEVAKRILFKQDMIEKGLTDLNHRYNILDLHQMISFREGFGLPHIEAMAAGIPTSALDWCSGTEICANNKGYLIPKGARGTYGTWGNARDFSPDYQSLVDTYNRAYHNPSERAMIAQNGFSWVTTECTWENATNQLEAVLNRAMTTDKKRPQSSVPQLIVKPQVIKPAGLMQESVPVSPIPGEQSQTPEATKESV